MFFGAQHVVSRRGLIRGEVSTAVFVTVVFAIPFFVLVAALTGELALLLTAEIEPLLLLGAAGIIHFVLGRSLIYWSIKLIGSNRASSLVAVSTLITVVLGITILGEPGSFSVLLGAVLVVIGVVLVSDSGSQEVQPLGLDAINLRKGVVIALIAAFVFGVTPLFVRVGLLELKAAIAGTLISYIFAAAFYAVPSVLRRVRAEIRSTDHRSIVALGAAAVFVNLGQLFRYVALAMMPASIATPIVNVYPLFTLSLGYFANRRIDIFSLRLAVGVVVIILGINILYFLA